MLTVLNLSSVVERVRANVSYLKCLFYPYFAPHYAHYLRVSLDPVAQRPNFRPGVRTLVNTVTLTLHCLHLDIHVADVDHEPPPWRIPQPHVTFTPTSKTDPPSPLQKQLALEYIASPPSLLRTISTWTADLCSQMSVRAALFTRWMWTRQRAGWAAGYLTIPAPLSESSSTPAGCKPHLSATGKWCGDM